MAPKPAARRPQAAPQRQQQTTRPPAQTQQPRAASRAVTTQQSQVPAYLKERLANDAGKGVSTDTADNLVPMVYLLQAQSPQAMRGNEKAIEGAQPSDIWLRNAPEEVQIQPGQDGIVFQHCFFKKDWVEWMPNRGGFAGRHDEKPEIAELVDEKDEQGRPKKVWRLPNGNAVVETRYHNGYVYVDGMRPLPYSIPFSSTGHSVSKAWMFSMNGEQAEGVTLPAPAVLWRLTTKLRTKNNLSWYVFEVSKEGYATEAQYEIGIKLHDAFDSGEKKIEEPQYDGETDTGGEAGDRAEHM